MRLALALVCVSTLAHARGHELLSFRVDVATGKVTANAVAAPPRLAFPAAQPVARLLYDSKRGTVTLGTLSLHVGTIDTEWMPWSVVESDTAIFDWREIVRVAGKPDEFRDVVRGVDVATGKKLWRRAAANTLAQGVGIGDRVVALWLGAGGVELVDGRTGVLVQTLGTIDAMLASAPVDGGDTLVDTGAILARVSSTGATIWKLEHLGNVGAIMPIAQPAVRFQIDPRFGPLPARSELLAIAQGHLARFDAATGRLAWSVVAGAPGAAPPMSGFLVDGTHILIADLHHSADASRVKLLVRDLATGRMLKELVVLDYTKFSDFGSAEVVGVSGDVVEVNAGFGVLD